MRALLREAPATLDYMESNIGMMEAEELAQVDVALAKIDSLIERAARQAATADPAARRSEAGLPPDPNLPPERRLAERLYGFVQKRMDTATFIALVREWAGDGAFQDPAFTQDPGERGLLSAWLVYDKVLPGQDRRGIERFALEQGRHLPKDEQQLLGLWRQDRPSIFRIESIQPEECYNARDLLANDVLRIRDWMSLRTLSTGAIVLARYAPSGSGPTSFTLGPLTEIPAAAWPRLQEYVEMLREESRGQAPNATEVDFFRAHHAQIRRRLRELA